MSVSEDTERWKYSNRNITKAHYVTGKCYETILFVLSNKTISGDASKDFIVVYNLYFLVIL